MIFIPGTVPDLIKESVKSVQTANNITHQIWREDNTLLGYAIKSTDIIEVYPLRQIDIGQLYAELDIQGLVNYSVNINNNGDLDVVDSIRKAEDSLDIDSLKALKISRMKNRFDSMKIRPKVEIFVGDPIRSFNVDGSKDDISNFQSYLDLLLISSQPGGIIKDADSIMQQVTTDELNSIIIQIKQHGLGLYQLKWSKEAELFTASTIEEVKAISIAL